MKSRKKAFYIINLIFVVFFVDIFLPYGLNLIIDKTLQHAQKSVFHLHDLEPFHNI